MELILLQNIHNLGELGDRVTVKPGYGRNYLVPQGKALPATKENIEIFEKRRAELEARAAERKAAAQARQEAIDGQTVTITANASGEGKLYGSVGTREIAAALTEAGCQVDKSEIDLPEGAFREVGEYHVDLTLYADITATVTVIVIGEEESGALIEPKDMVQRAAAPEAVEQPAEPESVEQPAEPESVEQPAEPEASGESVESSDSDDAEEPEK